MRKVSWMRRIAGFYVDFMAVTSLGGVIVGITNFLLGMENLLFFLCVYAAMSVLYFILFKAVLKKRTFGEYCLKIKKTVITEGDISRKVSFVEPVKEGVYLPWYCDLLAIVVLNDALKVLFRTIDWGVPRMFLGRIIEGLPSYAYALIFGPIGIALALCLFRASKYVFVYFVFSMIPDATNMFIDKSVVIEYFQRYTEVRNSVFGIERTIPPEMVERILPIAAVFGWAYIILWLFILIWKRKLFLNKVQEAEGIDKKVIKRSQTSKF